ncbi:MAG: elongation factor P [Candidatus Saganbacteria bacterium]|nr:elongation factor P [Candidatus Saganbacteria bacterium]
MLEFYLVAIAITDIKPGVTFEWKGNIFRCVKYDHIKWAQQARIRLKMKNLRTGAIFEDTFNVGERFEGAHISYQKMQYLYHDNELYNFMDQETFDQIALTKEQIGNEVKYLKEEMVVDVAMFGDEALEVTLPTTVELKVTETAPGFKGDTVSGGKPATLETGAVISVPFHVKIGDVLLVNTQENKYLGRA